MNLSSGIDFIATVTPEEINKMNMPTFSKIVCNTWPFRPDVIAVLLLDSSLVCVSFMPGSVRENDLKICFC